ncbi:MAG TPA: hypothetical protein VFS00_20200, partial [Polyangiaceae bacterium]|nr:hypothetical protein [Polyangiaceae bacterium]
MTPARPEPPPLARVTYADAGRTATFQLAVAASSFATVAARRAGGVAAAGVAACTLALAVALFARSRRRLGRVTVVAEGGALRFGDAVTLRAPSVTLWTLTGGRARLYTREGGWTIWPVEPSSATAAALAR